MKQGSMAEYGVVGSTWPQLQDAQQNGHVAKHNDVYHLCCIWPAAARGVN